MSEAVARVTLNRPEKRNALNSDLIACIRDGLRQAAADDAVRVVLIDAEGKDFCAGADLAALEKLRQSPVLENLEDARTLADLFLAMRMHAKPIVAAVRGRALAGGCGLATACDLVLAAESAQFGYPEIRIGFIPAIVMAMLRRSVPEKRAFELIARGESIPARTALEIGLINRVFPDASFESEVDSYVATLAALPPAAMSLAKELLYRTDGMSFAAALASGAQANVLTRLTAGFLSSVPDSRKTR